MNLVTVKHTTTYSYATPVRIDEHEIRVRPRAARDQRTVRSKVSILPDATTRSEWDRFGNMVDFVQPLHSADRLEIVSEFTVLHTPPSPDEIREAASAGKYLPLQRAQVPAIRKALNRTRPDPDNVVHRWAASRAGADPDRNQFEAMTSLNTAITREIAYRARHEFGTQDPAETLARSQGTCRDGALLLMEAARSLGFPARFVSGYLYDNSLLSGGEITSIGGMHTHAWTQIYLSGAGWVDFCPTNDYVGGHNLVRSSLCFDPSDIGVISGSYFGYPSDFIGMDIDVTISARQLRRPMPGSPDMPMDSAGKLDERTLAMA